MTELRWIGEKAALAAHGRLIALHGGAAGVRAVALLQSALARPQQHAAYNPEADVFDLAAVYAGAIIRNHPFVDGNKRTGFTLAAAFLRLNGWQLTASEEEATLVTIALAEGSMTEASYAVFLKDNAVAV